LPTLAHYSSNFRITIIAAALNLKVTFRSFSRATVHYASMDPLNLQKLTRIEQASEELSQFQNQVCPKFKILKVHFFDHLCVLH
jgi:hypothetical protein